MNKLFLLAVISLLSFTNMMAQSTFDISGTIIDKKTYEQAYTGDELLIRVIFTNYDITRVVAVVKFNGEEKTIHTPVSK